MGFGNTLREAYQGATELQRAGAANIASGLDWVGKQSEKITEKTKAFAKEVQEKAISGLERLGSESASMVNKAAEAITEKASKVAEAVADKATELATSAKDAATYAKVAIQQRAKSMAEAVTDTYRQAEKAFTDTVAGALVTACDYSQRAYTAVKNKLQEGVDKADEKNAEYQNKDFFDWDTIESKLKFGSEADGRSYKKIGNIDSPKPIEEKLEIKVQKSWKKTSLFYGDNDNNIQIGARSVNVGLGLGISLEDGSQVYGLSGEAQFAGISGQAKIEKLGGLSETNFQGEVGSAKASAAFGYTDGKDSKTIKAELGAEINLIKGTANSQIVLTPKTIYDNSLGLLVGWVKPEWSELPKSEWFTHGVFIGGEVEAGIGAAAKVVAEYDTKDGGRIGGLVGWGPMAGVYLIFGIK